MSAPGRWLRIALVAVCAAVILLLTLYPHEVAVDAASRAQAALGPQGKRGLADSLANILLFAPLGAAAALLFRKRYAPVLLGFGLSTFVELMQLVVPGRYSSPWDVAFNTTGAALGGLLVWHAYRLLHPGPVLRFCLVVTMLGGALTALIGSAALFGPAAIAAPLQVEWTPLTERGDRYEGRVMAAELGSAPLAPGEAPFDARPMARIIAGDTLTVTFATGPRATAWEPVLRIMDNNSEAALTVAVRGQDVAFSYRMWADALHLDQPELRFPDALAGVGQGRVVTARVWSDSLGQCLEVGGRTACMRPGFGDGWALVIFPVPGPLAAVLPLIWVALLLVPAGLWIARPPLLALALGAVAGLLVWSASWVGVARPSVWLLAAAALGLGAGYLLGRAAGYGWPMPAASARSSDPSEARLAR